MNVRGLFFYQKIVDNEGGSSDSNEAPRSSLLRRSSHFGYEGWKLRGILRNSTKPVPSFAKATEGSPPFIPVASYGVFGEGE